MSLTQAAASGVRWMTVATIVTAMISAVSILIIGRYVSPEAFGLMAMAVVVVGLLQVVSSFGLSQAVVQSEEPSASELSSVFWLGLILGVAFFGSLFLVRYVAAELFDRDELLSLIPFIGITLVAIPLGDKFQALLQKSLSFRTLAIVQLVSVVAGSTIATVLAINGRGVWALAIGYVATPVVAALALVAIGIHGSMIRVNIGVSMHAVRPLVKFGAFLTGSQSLNYFNSNIAQALIGGILGAQALGYYSMAHRLVLQPIQRINPIITQVAFPVLVRVRDEPSRMKRGYLIMLRVLSSINAPILFGLAATASVAIPFLLGENWEPMIIVLQILAIYSLLRSSGNAGGSLVLAIGRSDIEFYWNLALFLVIPAAITVAAVLGGLTAVAWTLLGLQFVLLFAWYGFVVRGILGSCLREYVVAIGAPIAIAAAMGAIVVAVASLSSLPAATTLGICVVVGVVAYTGLYWLFLRQSATELARIFLGRQPHAT